MSELLIDARCLKQALPGGDWVVFDARYSLSDVDAGRQAYREGHIPGAWFLDQEKHLAGTCTGTNGRHPLPEPDSLRRQLHRHGVTQDSRIVVYDANDGSFATRAWWVLRWLGFAQVAVLDGGLQAWCEAGGVLQEGDSALLPDETVAPACQARPQSNPAMATVSVHDILAMSANENPVIIDARTPERYRGESEPMDPVAGRIGGALNRPIASNVQGDGRFKPASQLRREFVELIGSHMGKPVIHYCGSGITACHNIFAMELAGLSGSVLYPGSWSEWCADPARPVTRG